MKVIIECVQADWIERYSDGQACSTTTEFYPSMKKAKAELKKQGYDKSEIDIDADNYEIGWLLFETKLEFDTNDKFNITVIP